MVSQKCTAPVPVEIVNRLAQRLLICAVLVNPCDFSFEFSEELLRQAILHKDIVTSDTSLSTIEESHSSDFRSCVIHVCRFIDHSWTFTTELENAWSQILGSCRCHKSTFLCASSIDNQIDGR